MAKIFSFDDHYEDIHKRCNVSIENIKAVIKAESESAKERLSRNQTVTLPGRCKMVPETKVTMGINGVKNKISAKAYVSAKISDALESLEEFIATEEDDDDIDEVEVRMIDSL